MSQPQLIELLEEVRRCRVCEPHLPLGANPVLRAAHSAKILVVGQAPGTRVHETGIPWNDPSGDRLRDWLQMSRDTFYDESQIAIIPMGLCYPGKGKGGDLPPRKECAEIWFNDLLALLPHIELTLLIGQYAQKHYLTHPRRTLTETVAHWVDYLQEGYFPLPHPSPRNLMWRRRNPWFEEQVVPALSREVWRVLEH